MNPICYYTVYTMSNNTYGEYTMSFCFTLKKDAPKTTVFKGSEYSEGSMLLKLFISPTYQYKINMFLILLRLN